MASIGSLPHSRNLSFSLRTKKRTCVPLHCWHSYARLYHWFNGVAGSRTQEDITSMGLNGGRALQVAQNVFMEGRTKGTMLESDPAKWLPLMTHGIFAQDWSDLVL